MPNLVPICTPSNRRVRRPGRRCILSRSQSPCGAVDQSTMAFSFDIGRIKRFLNLVFVIAIEVPIHLLMVCLLTRFLRLSLFLSLCSVFYWIKGTGWLPFRSPIRFFWAPSSRLSLIDSQQSLIRIWILFIGCCAIRDKTCTTRGSRESRDLSASLVSSIFLRRLFSFS
jgi:hypothetical protein